MFHHVSSCLIISHLNVSNVIGLMISILNVPHHILCGLVLSYPFYRIKSYHTFFPLIICHHFPQSSRFFNPVKNHYPIA